MRPPQRHNAAFFAVQPEPQWDDELAEDFEDFDYDFDEDFEEELEDELDGDQG